MKRILLNKWTIILSSVLILFVVLSNVLIIQTTSDKIYEEVDQTPEKKIALILGTSRYTTWGGTNLYFKYRIRAAVDLYKNGKVKHILVSGDNSVSNYNEPREMRRALIAAGIPEHAVTLDYAGFRTLDSVVRCKEVFGQEDVIIISQRFHLERALFIAADYDMDAIGFAAQDPPENYSFKTQFREYFAKTKAVIDLYVIHKEPKFLGKKEVIHF
ncbi:MAG: YdcF family protein [Flavobacteriales bacterium]|nr:YdcF family protein [Flavobacteriales bacterium]